MGTRVNDVLKAFARAVVTQARDETDGYYGKLSEMGRFPIKEDTEQLSHSLTNYLMSLDSFFVRDVVKHNHKIENAGLLEVLYRLAIHYCIEVEVTNNSQIIHEVVPDHGKPLKRLYLRLRNNSSVDRAHLGPLKNKPLDMPLCDDLKLSDSESATSADERLTDSSSDESSFVEPPKLKKEKKIVKKSLNPPSVKPSGSALSDQWFGTRLDQSSLEPRGKKDKKVKKRTSVHMTGDDSPLHKVKKLTTDGGEQELLRRREYISQIVEKHADLLSKLDKHLLQPTHKCEMCPVHCLAILNKTIRRTKGRKINKSLFIK